MSVDPCHDAGVVAEVLVRCARVGDGPLPQAVCAGGRLSLGMSYMEPSIKKIVDAYVRLGNRRAIEDLLAHRRRLSVNLRGRKNIYDFSHPIEQIDEEVGILVEALQQLGSQTVPPMPELLTMPNLATS